MGYPTAVARPSSPRECWPGGLGLSRNRARPPRGSPGVPHGSRPQAGRAPRPRPPRPERPPPKDLGATTLGRSRRKAAGTPQPTRSPKGPNRRMPSSSLKRRAAPAPARRARTNCPVQGWLQTRRAAGPRGQVQSTPGTGRRPPARSPRRPRPPPAWPRSPRRLVGRRRAWLPSPRRLVGPLRAWLPSPPRLVGPPRAWLPSPPRLVGPPRAWLPSPPRPALPPRACPRSPARPVPRRPPLLLSRGSRTRCPADPSCARSFRCAGSPALKQEPARAGGQPAAPARRREHRSASAPRRCGETPRHRLPPPLLRPRNPLKDRRAAKPAQSRRRLGSMGRSQAQLRAPGLRPHSRPSVPLPRTRRRCSGPGSGCRR
jgi:hypothetical protein